MTERDDGEIDQSTDGTERLKPDCFDCGALLYKAGTDKNGRQGWLCEECGGTFIIERIGRKNTGTERRDDQ